MTEGEHPELEALADHAEGLLDGVRAASVRSHLASCAHCRAREAELADVSGKLAATPAPRLPSDVAARIDEVVASPPRGARGASPPRRIRLLRLSGAAACLALVLVGGVLGVRAWDDGPVGSGSGETTTLSRERAPASGEAPAHTAEPDAGQGEGPRAGTSVTASGRDYSARGLPRQVSRLLRDEARGADARPQLSRPTPTELRPLTAPGVIARCVSSITGSQEDLLAVDLASFSGEPSAVIVRAGRQDAADVWVVDPSCSRVRMHAEVPRR